MAANLEDGSKIPLRQLSTNALLLPPLLLPPQLLKATVNAASVKPVMIFPDSEPIFFRPKQDKVRKTLSPKQSLD